MPEGPEIRRAADRIAKRLVGREIESIELHYPPIREFQSVVSDSQIVSVASRGKAMLTRFDCDLSMYSHNQLYGRWTVNRRSTELKWGRALRAEMLTESHAVRLWSATDVEIIPTFDEESHPFISRLGPDVLDESCTPEVIMEMLWCMFCVGTCYAYDAYLGSGYPPLWQSSIVVFILAWAAQFYGHRVEGQKPSFLEDLQYLMIGPAWLMSFIYDKFGIKY